MGRSDGARSASYFPERPGYRQSTPLFSALFHLYWSRFSCAAFSTRQTANWVRHDGAMPLPLDLGLLESDERFQTMCWYLARKEFPRAIPVAHGSWDRGRDIFCFGDDAGEIVWQCKFTQRSLTELKPKIIESLSALEASRPIAKWILCVPLDGSSVFLDWLRATISTDYPFIADWELWGKQQLLERLDKCPGVLEMFFYPVWKALESRFRTEELELVQCDLDPECGWARSDPGIRYIRQVGGASSDLVLDIIVRSHGTIQSLLQALKIEIHDVKRHLRGLPGEGLLYVQHTYPISLRGGQSGEWIERMEPPLLIEAGKHERFKVKFTNSGYAWTGYVRLTLLYAQAKELSLPSMFLRA
jgi:hypothetical protein